MNHCRFLICLGPACTRRILPTVCSDVDSHLHSASAHPQASHIAQGIVQDIVQDTVQNKHDMHEVYRLYDLGSGQLEDHIHYLGSLPTSNLGCSRHNSDEGFQLHHPSLW
jgi:hypothetical protein